MQIQAAARRTTFDTIVLLRSDGKWFSDVVDPGKLPQDAVSVKDCLNWGGGSKPDGLNDKVAVLPYSRGSDFLNGTREALADESLDFDSLETLLMAVSRRRGSVRW